MTREQADGLVAVVTAALDRAAMRAWLDRDLTRDELRAWLDRRRPNQVAPFIRRFDESLRPWRAWFGADGEYLGERSARTGPGRVEAAQRCECDQCVPPESRSTNVAGSPDNAGAQNGADMGSAQTGEPGRNVDANELPQQKGSE